MKLLINTPPSTLGYKKDECLISWKCPPMTEAELKKIASRDRFGDSEENMRTPNQVNKAVGYTLVQEERNNNKRKFNLYIVPTKECSTRTPDYRSNGWNLVNGPANKRFCPNLFLVPLLPMGILY